MGDTGFFQLLLTPATPLWFGLLMASVYVYRHSPDMLRAFAEWAKARAVIKGDRLDRAHSRLDRLEDREEECQRQLADALRRLAEVEGYMMGQGKARQDAAGIVALERLERKTRDER